VREASRWLPAPGTIISSKIEQREVDSDTASDTRGKRTYRNFPAITFEYVVAGRTFRGTRYSVRENVGNVLINEALAKFPQGAAVTVFYNPADPSRSVIERTMPEGAVQVMVLLSIILVAGSIGLVLGGTGLVAVIKPHLPNPRNSGAALFLAVGGLIVLRMGLLLQQQARVSRMWPAAKGRIGASGLDEIEISTGSPSHLWRPAFRSRVVYDYTVDGHRYAGDRVTFGATTISNVAAWVAGASRRYPQGATVDIFYDPSNPAEAVLERRVAGLWILWAIAAALLAAAARLAGLA
jgi:hypothetical protein